MKQKIKKSFDIYDAGLYLRLSRDDADEDGTKTESNSIANQRELLRNFVKSQPDIQIFDIYVDDGYSSITRQFLFSGSLQYPYGAYAPINSPFSLLILW